MTKNEFISQLREALEALPEEEREAALEYYSEYFEDAGEGNEEKAAAELGDPKQVAEQVAASSPLKKHQAVRPVVPDGTALQAAPPESPYAAPDRRNRKTVFILLIVLAALLGSPVWLALLSCVIAYAGITIGFVCGGVVGLFWGISELFSVPAKGIYDLGVAMVVFGLGALMVIPACWAVLRWIPALGRWISQKWKEL